MSPLKVASCVFFHNSHLDCFLFPCHRLRQPQDQLLEQTHIPAGWRPPTSHSKKCQFPSVNEQARSKITKPNPTKRAEVVLSCLLPRPALKCMLDGKQAGRSLAARGLPALLPAQSRQSIAKLSLLSPSTSSGSPCAANSRFHYSAPPPSFLLGFFDLRQLFIAS